MPKHTSTGMTHEAGAQASACLPGCLYLVATPIGNLGDMSFRAVETLKAVDYIASEDTRHSGILCKHFGITTPLVSYYREREQERAAQLLALLLAGKNIAVISDAGTPAISDPGAVLARLAMQAGIKVSAIPGASALICALAMAGLNNADFYFGGFLPATSKARQRALEALRDFPCPLVFYEAPHRIHACLEDLLLVLGDRQAQLFRELTKLHEERLAGNLSELCQHVAAGVKGEIVLLVAGQKKKAGPGEDELMEYLINRHRIGASLKESVASAAKELGLSKKSAYQAALRIWSEKAEDAP